MSRRQKKTMIRTLAAIAILLFGMLAGPGSKFGETDGSYADRQEQAGTQTKDMDGELEVHFIDVGHGDATLVKCGDSAMLIDTGDDTKGTALQNYLQKQGVTELEYLILTHPDKDHIGAAPVIISKFNINHLIMSDYEKDNKTYQKLLQSVKDRRLRAVTPEPGETRSLGAAVLTFLAPLEEYEDSNNSSVAFLLQYGQNRFLFTGDAEKKAEKDILESGRDIRAEVYQVGHHGSKTSSREELLDAVEPVYAVISCDREDRHGFPHAGVLNRFRERGIKVYRTDEQGTIIAVSDGTTISWNCAPSDSWKAGEPTG